MDTSNFFTLCMFYILLLILNYKIVPAEITDSFDWFDWCRYLIRKLEQSENRKITKKYKLFEKDYFSPPSPMIISSGPDPCIDPGILGSRTSVAGSNLYSYHRAWFWWSWEKIKKVGHRKTRFHPFLDVLSNNSFISP